jgi:hypothetical protein
MQDEGIACIIFGACRFNLPGCKIATLKRELAVPTRLQIFKSLEGTIQ